MKLRELKEKIDKIKDSDLDNDVVIECGHERRHIRFARNINYNKRDSKFTSRIFTICAE